MLVPPPNLQRFAMHEGFGGGLSHRLAAELRQVGVEVDVPSKLIFRPTPKAQRDMEAAVCRASSRWARKLEKEGFDIHEMTPRCTTYAFAFKRIRMDRLRHQVQLGPVPRGKGRKCKQHTFPCVVSMRATTDSRGRIPVEDVHEAQTTITDYNGRTHAGRGLAPRDVVLAVNGVDVRKDEARGLLLNGGSGQPLVVDILRDD